MGQKIKDNTTYAEFQKQLEGMKDLRSLVKLLPCLGIKNKKLNSQLSQIEWDKLDEIEKEYSLISDIPDRFNEHFSSRGWIAHESMNYELMVESVTLAQDEGIEKGEQQLINHYSSKEILQPINWLLSIDEFKIRHQIILLAYEDTLAERYHASVPILLMMMDGIVNDIDKNKGLFSSNIDLTAWDSIAAHSTGLAVLKDIFNDTRRKTTTGEISIPYRNGILHGRDLGYANRAVTAKCWAALFSIFDWAKTKKLERNSPPIPEPQLDLTILETLAQLGELFSSREDHERKNHEVSKKVANWKPRNIKIGIDIPESGPSDIYGDITPEQEIIRFIQYWKQGNYGAIAQQIHHSSGLTRNIKKQEELGKYLERRNSYTLSY